MEGQGTGEVQESSFSPGIFEEARAKLFSGTVESGQLKSEVRRTLAAALDIAKDELRQAKQRNPNTMHTEEEKKIFELQSATDVIDGLRDDPTALKDVMAAMAEVELQREDTERLREIDKIPKEGMLFFRSRDPYSVQAVNERYQKRKVGITEVVGKINDGAKRWAAKL